jgi:hypothetical protein
MQVDGYGLDGLYLSRKINSHSFGLSTGFSFVCFVPGSQNNIFYTIAHLPLYG